MWTLHPPQAARNEAPHLDASLRSRVLAAAEAAAASERFDLFAAAPEWHEAYQSLNFRTEFYNRLVRETFTANVAPFLP